MCNVVANKLKIIAAIALTSAVFWAAAGYAYLNGAKGDIAATLYPLPPLTIEKLGSTEGPELNSLAGKPYFINFWASWCVTCQAENIILHSLAQQGIPLVGIALKDSEASALQWLKSYGSPYIINLQDPDGVYAEAMGFQGAPETFLIDGDGNVRFHYQGLLQEAVWENRIKTILDSLSVRNER